MVVSQTALIPTFSLTRRHIVGNKFLSLHCFRHFIFSEVGLDPLLVAYSAKCFAPKLCPMGLVARVSLSILFC